MTIAAAQAQSQWQCERKCAERVAIWVCEKFALVAHGLRGVGVSGRRCCRQHMTVNLRELEGFEFIMQPAEFDAYYCVGKCPPRYLPRNDHSLLQSLLHLKHRGGRGKGIKRPCCSPSKFESIDILHLDEQDSRRLKVTNWKNIIVSECACA